MKDMFTHLESERPFAINGIDTGTNEIELVFSKDSSEALGQFAEGSAVVPLDGRWCDYCPETYWSGGDRCPTCLYDHSDQEGDEGGIHGVIDRLISEAHALQMNLVPEDRVPSDTLYAAEVSRIAKLAELIEKTIIEKNGQ